MPDDNSPQLGGQDRDDAPMISGRGTKIIVSARGAYEAGNLKALVDLLGDDRMRIFKQTIIRFAHSWVLRVMERFPELQERIPEIWNAVPLVEQWMADPNDQNEQAIRECLHGLASGDLPNRIVEVSILALVAGVRYPYPERRVAINVSAADAVACAFFALHPQDNQTYHEVRDRLDHWYLELAWALLQHKSAPPPPSLGDPDAR